MQTVCNTSRCCERQSDGSEYKKTLRRRRGSAPDPAERAYSAPANPLVGGEGLAVPSPRTPSPALGPSGLASSTPTPQLVPTPLNALLRCGDQTSPGITERRNDSLGLYMTTTMMMMMMKDKRVVSKMDGKTFFEAPAGCQEPGLLSVRKSLTYDVI